MASPPTTPLTGPTENEAGPVGLDLARLVPNPLHGAPPSKLALGDDGADSEDEYAACEDDGVPPPEGERESSEMRRRPRLLEQEVAFVDEKLPPAEKAQNDKEETLHRQVDAFKSEVVCIAIVCRMRSDLNSEWSALDA